MTNQNLNKIICSVFVLTLFAGVLAIARPKFAEAQLGGKLACSINVGFSDAVPVWDKNTETQKNVTCTWNGIAWQMAHVVLHQLTTSVVNWINSGFEGNPSFLTDPEGFFLDAADQATGAFISANGPLQALCSPFNLDIRLAIALGQTSPNYRYACTLSTIIKNAGKGRVSVGVTANQGSGATLGDLTSGSIMTNSSALSINGNSAEGFMAGDFSQGGWPAFIAMTTVPENNPYGAYLQSYSDLQEQIAAKQNAINKDLDRGAGFLSWQKCDNVPVQGGPSNDYGGEMNTGGGTKKVCRTETPGSVISSSLNKQLGAPTDELGLTSEINQVVSALFSQLMMKVLGGGLYASSDLGSGSGSSATQSYINQLSNDPQLNANFSSLKQQAADNIHQSTEPVRQAYEYRNQSLALMITTQNAYIAVRVCIANRIQQNSSPMGINYMQSQLTALDSLIASSVTPQVIKYQNLTDVASSTLSEIEKMEARISTAGSSNELSALSTTYLSQISTLSSTATDVQAAKADLDTAVTVSRNLQNSLTVYQSVCNGNTISY